VASYCGILISSARLVCVCQAGLPASPVAAPLSRASAVCKLAKKGLTPSQIGVILRDSHGVAQVKSVTGNKILRLLKKNGLAPSLPEDLYHLIKKAVSVRKHLERNRNDKDSKFRLILIESRIHRIARYYKTARQLPPNWRYESVSNFASDASNCRPAPLPLASATLG
jgi:small subunit ribosomal protein S13e